jgi:hypothetical protein
MPAPDDGGLEGNKILLSRFLCIFLLYVRYIHQRSVLVDWYCMLRQFGGAKISHCHLPLFFLDQRHIGPP